MQHVSQRRRVAMSHHAQSASSDDGLGSAASSAVTSALKDTVGGGGGGGTVAASADERASFLHSRGDDDDDGSFAPSAASSLAPPAARRASRARLVAGISVLAYGSVREREKCLRTRPTDTSTPRRPTEVLTLRRYRAGRKRSRSWLRVSAPHTCQACDQARSSPTRAMATTQSIPMRAGASHCTSTAETIHDVF